MKKWEYKTMHALKERLFDENIELAKNKLGEEGWELVAVEHPCYYFKREKQSEIPSSEHPYFNEKVNANSVKPESKKTFWKRYFE